MPPTLYLGSELNRDALDISVRQLILVVCNISFKCIYAKNLLNSMIQNTHTMKFQTYKMKPNLK